MQRQLFKGIFGLWPWPIINLILSIFMSNMENIEEWEVVRDSEGLPKSIIVKRTVKRVS